ncbi:MAG TPA: IS66 family insertion sequence element accessory protein TnpB [Desulfatirhabdiaceae bacterium]|nr:IS66 family insertion sequence element accessory protein TnpB [Desulfatirhabdiaceae bacterium]
MKEKTRTEELTEIRSFWKNQIEGWQESGLPQVEYCRKHNLIPHRFTYWKQKLVKKTTEAPLSLVQVNMKAHFNTRPASPLRLVFSNPLHVEIDRGFDPVTLRQLVYALRQV